MSAPTPGPWEVAVLDAALDPVEQFREMLSFGTGPIWAVWVPQHPMTRGGHPRPEHAVLASIVGNGPASKANADLIAASPDLLAFAERYAASGDWCVINGETSENCECVACSLTREARATIAKARGGR
ncbi:MAG: hypothetical protein Q8K32_31470 [Archangium sp.]|nr:hypothetical protein [Archangium sp.]